VISRISAKQTKILLLWATMSFISVLTLFAQTRRVIALFDFSYFTDLAVRINEGQIPYVDIPMFASPGSYLQLAALLRVFPGSYKAIFVMMAFQSVVCCALVISVAVTRSKGLFLRDSILTYFCVFPVGAINIYSLFHQPYYDADAIIWVIAGISCLSFIWCYDRPASTSRFCLVSVGVVLGLPFIYKQTFGIAWITMLGFLGFVCFIFVPRRRYQLSWIFSGVCLLLGIFFLWLLGNSAAGNWIEWTIKYPLKMRNSSPRSLFDVESKQIFVFAAILIASFWYCFSTLYEFNRHWSMLILWLSSPVAAVTEVAIDRQWDWSTTLAGIWAEWMPSTIFLWMIGFILFAISGPRWDFWDSVLIASTASIAIGLLAQGYKGSSHAIWPLLFVLFCISYSKILEAGQGRLLIVGILAPILVSVFLFSGLVELQRYNWMYREEPLGDRTEVFGWVQTPGLFLQDSIVSANLYDRYSKMGKTAVFPGEEPVAFLTNHAPKGNVSASDRMTNPYFDDLGNWLDQWMIQFVIVRTTSQAPSTANALDFEGKIRGQMLNKKFELVETKGPFKVLRRKIHDLTP
jgi:hypothetical protein